MALVSSYFLLFYGLIPVHGAVDWVLPEGHCLGDCEECYEFLSAPVLPLPGSRGYLNSSLYGLDVLEAFVSDPDVCDTTKLHPIHPLRHVRVLSACGAELGEAIIYWCEATRQLLQRLFPIAVTMTAGEVLDDTTISNQSSKAVNLMHGYSATIQSVVSNSTSELGGLVPELGKGIANMLGPQEDLSIQSVLHGSGLWRQSQERAQLMVALEQLYDEVTAASGGSAAALEGLPQVQWSYEIYGRHWDVVDRLFTDLGKSPKGSFVEVGMACGPNGRVLLDRYDDLVHYIAMDPNLDENVLRAFGKYHDRAKILPITSSEVAEMVADESIDMVFIDGPHTYQNVKNDLRLWYPKVAPMGVVSGHDFTCQHPPLMWAVLEFARSAGVERIHVGMDGVWWWLKHAAVVVE
ncbi:hypothetical protein FOZ60_009519 [Perkinsus olseni]|uniref:Uncharacterized protein n=1 Tax=Perkinsus olseni TaxID=32597 RepID=A0A7J6NH35_PEROL|nr:hypothetical protein FOZ60_009519 [Perkinsus olseni]